MEKLWYKIFGSNKEVVIERYQTIEKHITVRKLKYNYLRISVFQFTHTTYRESSLVIVNELSLTVIMLYLTNSLILFCNVG